MLRTDQPIRRSRTLKKPLGKDMILRRLKSVRHHDQSKDQHNYAPDFVKEIQMLSIDTIMKEYQTNMFFKVKIDTAL